MILLLPSIKIKYWLLLSLAIFTSAHGSKNTQTIIFYSGDVHLIDLKGENSVLSDSPYELYEKDTIVLHQHSEVYLMSSSGKLMVFANANLKPLKLSNPDINEAISDQSDKDIITVMREFMSSQSANNDQDLEHYAHMHRNAQESVMRGCTAPIMLHPIFDEKLLDEVVTFTWNAEYPELTYELSIFEENLPSTYPSLIIETTDTFAQLDLEAKPWFSKNQEWYWVAHPKDEPNCARYLFTVLSRENYLSKKEEASTILQENYSSTALWKIAIASYFESHGLIDDAALTYEEAIKEMNDPQLSDMYTLFCLRNALNPKF